MARCVVCVSDAEWLRSTDRSDFEQGSVKVRLVDLFAGCGGLSFGFAEAARRLGAATEVALAIDEDEQALAVFEDNLPVLDARIAKVESVFDGELGARLTLSERRVVRQASEVDMLVGGPPCQGHSDLNNRTRRADPRNRLYARMARAAEVLHPACVVIENVPSVRLDRARVVVATKQALAEAGYRCIEHVLNASHAGVPQLRRRHVLVAVRDENIDLTFLEDLPRRCPHLRSLGWAIRDLEAGRRDGTFDSASRPNDENRKRIAYLFKNREYDLPNPERPDCHDGDHSYVSMYGRLRWRDAAQTLTTGFGSMGQGRYVHPSRRRTITPHEAARIQTFPDGFDFGDRKRGALARMIGNAVPPLLNIVVGERLIPQIVNFGASAETPAEMSAASLGS